MAKTPKHKHNVDVNRKPIQSEYINFKKMNPAWQIGFMDINGKWGYASISEMVEFHHSEEILSYLIENGYEKFSQVLDDCKNKEFSTFSSFYKKLENSKVDLPHDSLHSLAKCLRREYFLKEIHPKLKIFESLTWDEIEQQTYGHDKRKTKHHFIKIERLVPEARAKLKEFKLDDLDELFSLRLEGKLRIFGIRYLNFLKILWFDRDHEICPCLKK